MDNKVDLNRGAVDELAALRGIGFKLAQRIVAYREEVHPFEEVIELTAVPGISERMVRDIENEVMVSGISDAPEAETAVTETPEIIELPPPDEAAEGMLLLAPPDEPEAEPIEADTVPAEPELVEGVWSEVTEAPEPESDTAELPEPEAATLKEEIAMAESPAEPDMAAPPPPTPPPPAPVAPSANRSLIGGIIGAIFGAIIGSVLTLAILSSLNGGTLSFASQERASALQRTIDENIESVRGEQSDLSGNVESMGGQLATVEAEQGRSMEEMQDEMDNLASTAVSLQGDLATTEARLDVVAESAENFDAFLNGLRDLLVDFQGAPPTPTATETATPTPTPAPTETTTVTATAVVTATATAAPATRTPRPTATPLVTATATE